MAEVFEKKMLEGKTAVITGGGSGINLSIAKRFAENGARVALIGRTREKLEAAASEIRDRQEMIVEVSTEHQDYFVKNLVAIRAEKRLCLASSSSVLPAT